MTMPLFFALPEARSSLLERGRKKWGMQGSWREHKLLKNKTRRLVMIFRENLSGIGRKAVFIDHVKILGMHVLLTNHFLRN